MTDLLQGRAFLLVPRMDLNERSQMNGKIGRFHRTLGDGWAFRRVFTSESARRKALPARLHEYNHDGPHAALRTAAGHLTNPSGHHT
jgi:transposase InsO family protein